MARNNASIGILFIAIAIFLLLGKTGAFASIGYVLWPVLILGAGLLLHFLYFGNIAPALVLVPAGVLVTISVMFFFCNIFGWHTMKYIWPGFILSVAVGLFELHLYSRYPLRGALPAALILTAVSAVFFAFVMLFTIGIYVIAIAFLAAGVVLLVRKRKLW